MKIKLRDVGCEVDLAEAMANVREDRENGILSGVVLLTGEKKTKNNTFYTKKALVEASTRYEGAKMFLDHGDSAVRSVRDLGGVYRNVHLEENKVIGDLKIIENSSVRDLVFSMAKEKVGGLSIRDRGKGREEGDIFMVEGFGSKNPFSIDLVTEPSSNINLFESENSDEEKNNQGGDNMKWSEITEAEIQKERPELIDKIRADEKKKVLGEVAEEIKNGKDAKSILIKAEKLTVLSEAELPNEVFKSVKKLIEQDGISLDMAKSIIENQKEVMKTINPTGAGKPKVIGHGIDRQTVEEEGKIKLSKEEEDKAIVESMTF